MLQPVQSDDHRSDEWLVEELQYIWSRYFPDTPRVNDVDIFFSRCWKTRLAFITSSLCGQNTYIGVNKLLRLPQVPDYVNTVTIAHELTHYAHGFGSPLPRKFEHPHRGGVVAKELIERGLGSQLRHYLRWTNESWDTLYQAHRQRPKK